MVTGGYRRLQGGSDDFLLHTNTQIFIIIYIYHHDHHDLQDYYRYHLQGQQPHHPLLSASLTQVQTTQQCCFKTTLLLHVDVNHSIMIVSLKMIPHTIVGPA